MSDLVNDLLDRVAELERRIALLEADVDDPRRQQLLNELEADRITTEVDQAVSRYQNRLKRGESHTFRIPDSARRAA